jgi:Tol biopolymer transport system component
MMRQIAGAVAITAALAGVHEPQRRRSAERSENPGVTSASLRLGGSSDDRSSEPASADTREARLTNVRQLTNGGENAEAYFSPDGSRLVFQKTQPPELPCDQIFTMKVDGTDVRRVSTGTGRTTCGFFYPDGKGIVFASTHLRSLECPPRPGYERGYVWPVYPGYDIFRARPDGSGLERLTSTDGYDAEATIGPDGRIVFTSVRDGDMEIYSMNADGSGVKRLTNRPGPDGGPFFSPDGRQIVFRGRVSEGGELADYRALLKEGLWRPTSLEIFVMNADGSNVRQVTKLGKASFAPYFHPDGKRIIFSTNVHDPKGRDFDIYIVNVDGSGLERVTWNATFDGFPMFSPDGRRLVFASNRNAAREGDTNVFIADWVEKP